MLEQLPRRQIEELRAPSVTDLVFDTLYRQVVELKIEPGTKLSEAEVSKLMGVSRQPVRDAFYRLSQLGFLLVRPQRATTVTQISVRAVHEARFVRTALELETVRAAAARLEKPQIQELDALIDEQRKAVKAGDKVLFHELDDDFHKRICHMSGHGYTWKLIRDYKAHMDRVRYLSLSFGAELALNDHIALMDALRVHDVEGAATVIREHLSRISGIIGRIRESHGQYFLDEE
ncbi:GntR family transcriptional regulator [Nitratireductor luteus]|uniref:GntR family transcriptional regulator n=1 Tax=Nitratireductor luteus TaxID=2976980 RepID=UPI002240DFED